MRKMEWNKKWKWWNKLNRRNRLTFLSLKKIDFIIYIYMYMYNIYIIRIHYNIRYNKMHVLASRNFSSCIWLKSRQHKKIVRNDFSNKIASIQLHSIFGFGRHVWIYVNQDDHHCGIIIGNIKQNPLIPC